MTVQMKLAVIPDEVAMSKIYHIRSFNVMLDSDLAELYTVETKRLNEQVKRNSDSFPEDFMFQLTKEEFDNLKSQFATSSWGGRRTLPFAFTEHGVLMLSSVLNSKRAIKVNIQIMRIYTRIRQMLLANKEILQRLDKLEHKLTEKDDQIMVIFDYLKQLEQAKQEEIYQGQRKTVKGYRNYKESE
jgi:cell division septum initiation protein DivIVA